MRICIRGISCVMSVVACAAIASGSFIQVGKTNSPAAGALLKIARDAMGGEPKLAGVKSLLLIGQVRTLNQMYGQDSGSAREYYVRPIEIRILFPDKYVETTTYESGTKNRVGFNGADPVPGLGPGKAPSPVWPQFLSSRQGEFARLALALLLRIDAGSRLILRESIGADSTLEFNGLGNSPVYVDLDKATHLPSRLRYQLQDSMADGTEMGAVSSWTTNIEDWRDVGGLKMPHHLSNLRAGKLYSEFLFKTIEINPPLTAADFK